MAKKTRAYVDTSALISFLDRSDTYHPLFVQLFSVPPQLVTTPLVVAEGQAWFLKRFDVNRSIQFVNFVESLTTMRLCPVGQKELRGAGDYLRRFSDQEMTLTDALGLWVMDGEKIDLCWSTDRHLALTKKRLVIYEP